jgi:hypothetical protein
MEVRYLKMATALSSKLMAKVVGSDDLEVLFPTPTFEGLVALDIYVDKGDISIGKSVLLASSLANELIVIRGIEMQADLADPNKIRIICTKPKSIKFPLVASEAWSVFEE